MKSSVVVARAAPNRIDGNLMTPSTLPPFQLTGRQQFLSQSLAQKSPAMGRLSAGPPTIGAQLPAWKTKWHRALALSDSS